MAVAASESEVVVEPTVDIVVVVAAVVEVELTLAAADSLAVEICSQPVPAMCH